MWVYFVIQNPTDVPEDIFGQLGYRVQHALRTYTAKEQRALRLAAETYRDNARFNTQDAILQVGVGEAVTSFLQKRVCPGLWSVSRLGHRLVSWVRLRPTNVRAL